MGSTDVFIGAMRCDVIAYYSDDTKLVCKTRQLHWKTSHNLQIKVALWSYTATSYAHCAVPGGCLFHYDGGDSTPYIEVSSSAAVPGGKLRFAGYLRGKGAEQYTITIDGKLCELRDVYEYHSSGGLEQDFTKHVGTQCQGSNTDSLRGFDGSAEECMAKCIALGEEDCAGFVRINSGDFAGQCFFRTGQLSEPYSYTSDDRDCFVFNPESFAGRKRRSTAAGLQSRQDEIETAFGYPVDAISPDAFSAVTGADDVEERAVMTNVRHFVREWCTLPEDIEAGRYNYTLHVAAGSSHGDDRFLGYGDAQFREMGKHSGGGLRDMARPDPNGGDAAYVLTVVPTIATISTPVAGVNGGDEFTVTGTGFHADANDCSANKVVLQGAECVVKAPCTATAITCTVADASAAEAEGSNYRGTSGLKMSMWTGKMPSGTDGWELGAAGQLGEKYFAPVHTAVTMGGTDSVDIFTDRHKDSYAVEEKGYFVAPKTTQYRFWCTGDDVVSVHLDVDGLGFVNMTKVAASSSATHSFYNGQMETKISEPITLQAGQRYPFMTRFIEWGGLDYWMVGVEVFDAGMHDDMFQYQQVNEIQRVYLQAQATRQVELITLKGVTGGSFKFVGKENAKSEPIEVNSIKSRKNQLMDALRNVYRHDGGRSCNDYSVAITEDGIGTRGVLQFAVTINCRPAVDADSGDAIPFPAFKLDIAGLQVEDNAVLHDAQASVAVSGINFGFEADEVTADRGYDTLVPAGWTEDTFTDWGHDVYLVKNGNGPWGGLTSGDGDYYANLHKGGAAITQTLTGLTAGVEYSVQFLCALRPGNAPAGITVTADGNVVYDKGTLAHWFHKQHASFVASGDTAELTFTNSNPDQSDRSVFVDQVQVIEASYLTGDGAVTDVTVTTDTRPSNPLSGKFQMTMESICNTGNCTVYGTGLVNWNDHHNHVQSALAMLPNVKSTQVTQSHTYADGLETYYHEVRFLAPKGVDHPLLAVTEDLLHGDGLTTWVETRFAANPNAQLHMPIPDDFLEVFSETPSATVRVNGVNARCSDETGSACAFAYDAEVTGVVEAVAAGSGLDTVTAGETLTITGTGLQHAGKAATVTFGGAACAVTAHSDTEIQCTVDHCVTGMYHPVVLVHGTGVATVANGVAQFKYGFQIDSVSPASSGMHGGAHVTITGTGFAVENLDSNTVAIGGASCKVVRATHQEVVCTAPAIAGVDLGSVEHGGAVGVPTTVAVSVGLFSGLEAAQQFSYEWSTTPSVTGMTPTATSAARTATVTLTVSNGGQVAAVGECTPSMTFVSPSGAVRECEQLGEPPSPATITITQAGGFQWTMASDAEGVVDTSTEHFPTLTIKQGTVVNFVGKVEKTHSFSVRSSDSGAVVVGPSDVAGSDAGVEYDFTWTASNAGTFEYFCEPHQSFMKGTIIVEAPAAGETTLTCVLVRAEPLPIDEQPEMFPRLQLCNGDGDMVVSHPAPAFSKFDLALRITATTPSGGSIAGGAHVEITGAGFVTLDDKIVRSALSYNYYDEMTVVNVALPDRMVGCAITSSSYSKIECITTMPESNRAVLTAAAKHSFTDGYNGKIAVSVNDFPVPGCGSDPDAPADMRDGAWSAWTGEDEHTYVSPTESGRTAYVCEYDYADATSPTITGVSPESGRGATALTIAGSGFAGASPATVTVGASSCVVTASSATAIECDLPAMTSGRYTILVEVPGFGFATHPEDADNAVDFMSLVEFSHITPQTSSIRGGLVVTIHGNGFSETLENNQVSIGGKPAHLVHAEHSQLVAVTPASASDPLPCAINQPCNSPEMYVQIKYAGDEADCSVAGPTCVAYNSETGSLDIQRCTEQSGKQLFRMEQMADVDNELAIGRKQAGVYRLHRFDDDAVCLEHPAMSGENCEEYSFQPCSASKQQKFHATEHEDARAALVLNFGGGADDRALDVYANLGCTLTTKLWHCRNNYNAASKYEVLVTQNVTGRTTPEAHALAAEVQVTVFADEQQDYAYGQTKPVARVMNEQDNACGAFGGHYELVFRQTAGTYLERASWMNQNANDTSSDTFSVLDQLDDYRKSDGTFEFQMVWPEREGANTQTWIQTSNPVTHSSVVGYKPVLVKFTSNHWEGLARSSSGNTLLDGSPNNNNWYYAIGSNTAHSGGIPGPGDNDAAVTELWACSEGDEIVAQATNLISWTYDTTRDDASITVETGSTVTWTFALEDAISGNHRIVSGKPGDPDGTFESYSLPRDGVWQRVFNQTGDFHYYSDPLGFLSGTISVRDNVITSPAAYRLNSRVHCTQGDKCTVSYTDAATPTIATVSPLTGGAGTTITLTGSGFQSETGEATEVLIGATDCVVQEGTITDTSVECIVGEVPAGMHTVHLTVAGQGTSVTSTSTVLDPDYDHRSYSSTYKKDDEREPVGHHARSMLSSDSGWAVGINQKNEWLQMDLDEVQHILGVVTLPRKDAPNQRVTEYQILTSTDAATWTDQGTFAGNMGDDLIPVSNTFSALVLAKHVRIVVKAWGPSHMSMRAGLLLPNMQFQSEMSVDAVTVGGGSFGGGTTVVISGAGFGTPRSSGGRARRADGAWGGWMIYDSEQEDDGPGEFGSKVELCNADCIVTESSYNEITCVTQPLKSIDAVVTYGHEDKALLEGVGSFSSNGRNQDLQETSTRAFDGDFTNKFVADGSWWSMFYDNIDQSGMYDDQGAVRIYHNAFEASWKGNLTLPKNSKWRLKTGLRTDESSSIDPLENFVLVINGETVGRYYNFPRATVHEIEHEFVGDVLRVEMYSVTKATSAHHHSKMLPYTLEDVGAEPRAPPCYVGMDLGKDDKAIVSRFRFFPPHQEAPLTEGGTFQTSSDFASWETLAEISNPHQGWNWVDANITDQEPARYIRYVGPVGSRCEMTQLEFYGFQASVANDCAVKVSTTAPRSHPSDGPMQTDHRNIMTSVTNFVYSYDHAKTGEVTAVHPRFGSSLGGEKVTITGNNLATTVDDATVTLNGKACAVLSAASDGTLITCITSARGKLNEMQPLSLIVNNAASGMGDAIAEPLVRYRYLDRWSQVNTWLNDEPPVTGDSVVIPEDQTILMDVSPPRLNWLQVNGMLVFDRKNLNLDATYILVYGGILEVGTEDEPFEQEATITLHGDRRETIELPFVGNKVLAVADKGGFTTFGKGRGVDVPISQKGVLDIHGIPRLRTWTKVDATVEAGSHTITTVEATDFTMGEIVVLTAPHQELTVANRIDDYTFTVVEEITHTHVSETRSHAGFDTMDMRCEVALLSRNIVIQGAGGPRLDGSATIEEGDDERASTEQLYGVHTGAFHGGHYRIENTELRHCGQAGNLGRYCMHFHVNDDNAAPNSYIKSNSIHHSFQRATTVHGTHHSLVQNNVAYHVMGHTYFVEDGDETFNTFDSNIGIFTKPSHMMLKSDKSPSTFWTAIPTNFWRNNIATDSTDRGAWFELSNQGITLEFFNNTFHNNGGIGFRNYPNYSPPSPQFFKNNTYFKNGGNGLFYKKGGDNHHVFSKFAENGVDIFWTKYSTHETSRLIPNVQDCLFWGGRGAQAIFGPQHEYWYVNGATFINYADSGAISACAGCCAPTSFRQGAYTYRFERLNWHNTSVRTRWTCPYKQILYDLDGTLTGHAGGTALPFYQFNAWEGQCAIDETGTYDKGHRGMICNDKVRVRRLQIEGSEPRELDNKRIFFKKSEMIPAQAGSIVDRFGNSDKFGAIDWEQYTKSGELFEGCLETNQKPVKGYCMWAGRDQNAGLQKYALQHNEENLDEAGCLAWCRTVDGATGCEQSFGTSNNDGCFVHTEPVDQGSGKANYQCWLFPQIGFNEDGTKKTPLHFAGCVGLDGLDFINFRQSGTNCGEFDGWAVPMVTHHDYYGDMDWHIDWQRLKLRWSEPYYFQEPYNLPMEGEESAMLRWPYVDYRYRYRTSYAGIMGNEKPWNDHSIPDGATEAKQLTRFDEFGAGLILREDDSLKTTGSMGEWKVALNPWLGVDESRGANAYKIDIEALQCAPTMCGLPGDNSQCMTNGAWDNAKCPPIRWSDKATWTRLRAAELNTVDIEHTGLPPVDGDSVEIPRNTYVILDVDDCPKLDKLVVTGRLVVERPSIIRADVVRRIEANRMLVWGSLEVGSESQPYTGSDVEIKLHGVRTSDTLVAVEHHFLGNKNMVVFGDVQLHGKPRSVMWTTLASTAGSGDTQITVDADVASSWSVGDQIVITGTEYPVGYDFEGMHKKAFLEDYVPHEAEVRTITNVEGAVVSLNLPLANRHFAGIVQAGENTTVSLKAHVGLLTHNIRVTADLTDSPVEGEANWYTGYGGHIVVGEANYGNYTEEELVAMRESGEQLGIVRKLGSLVATGVEFRDLGKLASEHPAVQYRYFSLLEEDEIPENRIEGCSFVDSWNYVVATERSQNVQLINNVIHRNFRSAIDIDLGSKGTVLRNNLVGSVHRSVDAYTPSCKKDQSCWTAPFAAFSIWNKDFAEISGNVVAGSEDIGFMVYPLDLCDADEGALPRISNNEAYGTLVGMFVLALQEDVCHVVSPFKAWKNAHLGIVTVDQGSNLRVQGAVLADNHQGISLNFVRTGWESFSVIEDSVILGSTDASVCGVSEACRAMNKDDVRGLGCNSEFGASWRRVGVVMPQYTNLGKTCEANGQGGVCRPPIKVHRRCSLPWENRFGNLNVKHAKLDITNTVFAHWKTSDCSGKSRAIASNPSQPDFNPRTTLSKITWDHPTVDADARFQLGDASYQTHEATACRGVMGSCDAVNYFTVVDADGTSISSAWSDGSDVRGESFTMLSAFNPAIARADKCIADADTQSIVCRDYSMTRLVVESDPERFQKRRLGPTTITKYSDTPKYEAADNRTSWSVGPFPQGCSCQKHFAQFTMEVEAGLEYDIFTTAVLADRNRISFNSEDESECIVAKLLFSKPQALEVHVATKDRGYGEAVPKVTTGIMPTVSDPSGTNLHHPQERMLYVTLCGGSNNAFWMVYTSKIQVTATIAMTVDEFFATEDPNTRTTGTDSFITNVALLLGIPHSQIKVTCVHAPGDPCIPLRRARRATDDPSGADAAAGVVVEFEIEAPQTTIDDETGEETSFGTDETRTYLTDLLDEIEVLAKSGTLSTQLESAGFAAVIFDAVYDDKVEPLIIGTANTTDVNDVKESASGTPIGGIVGGVVGGVILIGALVAFFIYRNKATPRRSSMSGTEDGIPMSPIAIVRGSVHGRKADVEDAAAAAATAIRGRRMSGPFPAQDEPSYFSKQSRAEVQADSLFDAGSSVPVNPAATLRKDTALI